MDLVDAVDGLVVEAWQAGEEFFVGGGLAHEGQEAGHDLDGVAIGEDATQAVDLSLIHI